MLDQEKEALFDERDAADEYDPFENSPVDEESATAVSDDGIPAPIGEEPDEAQPVADTHTDAEKIAALFKSMPPHRRKLLDILESCREKQKVSVIIDRVDEVLRSNFSVYKAVRFCNLLEQAGAILKITEDGTNYADAKAQPILVEEDGVEYLKAGEPPEAFWVTTEEGCAYLNADDPLERLRDLLESEPVYHPIYKRILLLCSNEEGRRIGEISDALDGDPLLQKPRRYAQRFVDVLEKCDALVWDKTWKVTRIGQLGLEEIGRFEEATAEEEAAAVAGDKTQSESKVTDVATISG